MTHQIEKARTATPVRSFFAFSGYLLADQDADPFKPVVLPTGVLFDAVIVSKVIGMATVGVLRAQGVALGPVLMSEWASKVGFLIPPDSGTEVQRMVDVGGGLTYRHLGAGDYIVVPGAGQERSSASRWLVGPGPLTNELEPLVAQLLVQESLRVRSAAQPR